MQARVSPLSEAQLRARLRAWRIVVALAAVALAVILVLRVAPRSSSLPLVTSIDGPPPAQAAGVLVYLHGRGGTVASAESMVKQLREAGLPPDVAVVLLEGPYSTPFGHSWGDSPETQATSRARVRSRLRDLLGDAGPPRARTVIAGFSQGAGVAIDLAVEEPRFGALASFSPCYSSWRGELPKREDLRVLMAHGSRDARCPVEESQSLARVLTAAHKPPQYIQFDGPHIVPPEAVRALVALATAK